MRETGKGGVQDRCVIYARNRGWYARKFKSPANNAVPDYLFVKDGAVIFVEFKATGGVPEPLQDEEHKLIRAAGGTVWVIDDPELFKVKLDYHDSQRHEV